MSGSYLNSALLHPGLVDALVASLVVSSNAGDALLVECHFFSNLGFCKVDVALVIIRKLGNV